MSVFGGMKKMGEKHAGLLAAGILAVLTGAFTIGGGMEAYGGDSWAGGSGAAAAAITYTNDSTEPFDNYGLPGGGTLKMCKYYRYNDGFSGTVTEISYYSIGGAGRTIQVQDERQGNGFELKEWFTSTDGWTPEDNQDPSIYNWEEVVKTHADGTYKGTGEQLLEISETDPDIVIHLMYEFEGSGDGQPLY